MQSEAMPASPLFELGCLLVRLDHVARLTANANDSRMSPYISLAKFSRICARNRLLSRNAHNDPKHRARNPNRNFNRQLA